MEKERRSRIAVSSYEALLMLGLGLYWPLMRWSTYSAVFPQVYFFLTFILTCVATALFTILLRKSFGFMLNEHPSVILLVSSISALCGVLGIVSNGPTLDESALWMIAAICYGVVFVVLTISWGETLATMTAHRMCLVVVASFFVSTVILSLVMLWSPLGRIVPFVAPLATSALWYHLHRGPQRQKTSSTTADPDRVASWDLIVILGFFLLFGSIVRSLYYAEKSIMSFESTLYMHLFTLAFCILIFCAIMSGSKRDRQEKTFLQAWIIIAIVFLVGLLLILTYRQEQNRWGDEITLVARMMISLFLWIMLADSAKCSKYPIAVLMSSWVLAESCSSLLAYYLGSSILTRIGLPIDILITPTTFAMIAILMIGSFLFLQKTIFSLKQTVIVSSIDTTRSKSCKELAYIYNLSPRGLEIMDAYSRGSSSKAIAKTLYISPETVRTHIKNIYEKLGIHKKQDLFDIVEYKEREIALLSSKKQDT